MPVKRRGKEPRAVSEPCTLSEARCLGALRTERSVRVEHRLAWVLASSVWCWRARTRGRRLLGPSAAALRPGSGAGGAPRAGPLGGWEAPTSPVFFPPRRPSRCRRRPGAARAGTRSTRSRCGRWGSGTAWRWGSPIAASAAAAPGWRPTAPGAAATGLTCAACASATPATWAPGASARKGRARAGTRTCAGKPRASPCAAGAGSAAATSAPASRASLGRSTALSASVTTSPVPGTKGSSAQVGTPQAC